MQEIRNTRSLILKVKSNYSEVKVECTLDRGQEQYEFFSPTLYFSPQVTFAVVRLKIPLVVNISITMC